jgi:hypothetical protein
VKGEAKTLYESIRQDLIRIHANWRQYVLLFAESDESYEIMNGTAPGFFRLLQDMLVDNAVISLSRLTDPSSYNSIARLIKLIKNQVNHEYHSSLEKDLSSLELICADIREHRHKRVAHRVRKAKQPDLQEQPQRLPPLTRQKIENAMDSMSKLMNKVLGYFESVEQIYVPAIPGEADALLFYLDKGLEAARPSRVE